MRVKLSKSKSLVSTSDSKPKVCRNLFGPVDHDLTQNFLKRQLAILMDSSSQVWDFDFANEVPRPGGRFLWEAVVCPSSPKPVVKAIVKTTQPTIHKNFKTRFLNCSVEHRNFMSDPHDKIRMRLIQSSLKGFMSVRKRTTERIQTCAYKELLKRSLSLNDAHCSHTDGSQGENSCRKCKPNRSFGKD